MMMDEGSRPLNNEEKYDIIQKEYPNLLLQIQHILLNIEDTKDTVQEACKRFWACKTAKKASLLFVIAKNLASNRIKERIKERKKTVSIDLILNTESEPFISVKPLNEDKKELLSQAISLLKNKRYREAIHLYYFDENSREEGAKKMGISTKLFSLYLYRARKHLHRLLTGKIE